MTNINDLTVAGGQLLRPGILYENMRVEFGEYYYFQACLPKYNEHHHFHNIEIQVTAKDGDPDLYISPIKMRPTKTTSTRISKSIGSETITLPSNVKEFLEELKLCMSRFLEAATSSITRITYPKRKNQRY